MKKKEGFTLIELLMVVIIIAVLVSIGVPQYTKAIERSRATEAMAMVKVINDAIYAHAAGRDQDYKCEGMSDLTGFNGLTFDELSVALPANTSADLRTNTLETKYFKYVIPLPSASIKTIIPGTNCKGAYAQRINGGEKYNYVIWNPYTVGRNRKLACFSPGDKKDSKSVCTYLGLTPFTKKVNDEIVTDWEEAKLW